MKILFMTSPAPAAAGFSTKEKRPPIGLGYLMSVARECGHEIYFSDEYLKESSLLEQDFLQRYRIEWVGIYVNTVCFQGTLKLLDTLQRKRVSGQWQGKIIVGGPHTAVAPETIPEFVDHLVIGEGEVSLPKILDGKLTDRVVYGEKVPDLDKLPRPSWDKFIFRPYDWGINWFSSVPVYPFNTSRGCPFDCAFCSVNAVWGKQYRIMSAERIVEDIEYMIRYYGARGIFFREDNFTLNAKRVDRFCRMLLDRHIDINWFCETRVNTLLDEELQRLMARAGCRAFYIGVESGSPGMLERLKKGITVEQIEKAFAISKQVGIKTYASLIVGVPGETENDLRLTDELLGRIRPDFVSRNVYVGIPGSELYDFVKAEGLYEFRDTNGILYPVGYKSGVQKYYNDNPCFRVY